MAYDKFRTQRETRQGNEDKIIEILNVKPQRFKDLQKTTGLSPMGLNKVLQRLVANKLIKKVFIEDHEAYNLTEDGINYYKEMWLIVNDLLDLKQNNANFKSSFYPFGIRANYVLDKKIDPNKAAFMLLLMEYLSSEWNKAFNLQMFDLIKNGINGKKLIFDKPESGKLVLAIEIDFSVLSDYYYRCSRFVDDLLNGIDPLKDKELKLEIQEYDFYIKINGKEEKGKEEIIMPLNRLYEYIQYASSFVNKNIMINFLETLYNKKFFDKYGADFLTFNKFNDYIKTGKNPFNNNNIVNKMIYRLNKNEITNNFPLYILLSRIFNYYNEELQLLLNKLNNDYSYLSKIDNIKNDKEVKQ